MKNLESEIQYLARVRIILSIIAFMQSFLVGSETLEQVHKKFS